MQCCSPFAVERGSRQKSNQTGIPSQMKAQFENSSGFSFDDVRVHYNSDKPAKVQALAYTQGNEVYMGPGQEQHLGHELGHVVQQKAGMVRATTTIGGLPVNDDPEMEKQADRIGSPAVQMKREPVVQRLRLRLNDNIAENRQFGRLRQVPVSAPANIAVSNTPASNKLQKHYTPDVEGATIVDKLSSAFGRQCSEYGPAGAASTLGVNEDIILEGHGSDVGMEDYTPIKIAEIAQKIIMTCGYNAGNPWQGKLILLGCDTGQYAQAAAISLRAKVGFQVTVVGTERNIRVNEEAGGVHYAEEDWDGADAGAPTNLAAIMAFDDFLNRTLLPPMSQIISVLGDYDRLILDEQTLGAVPAAPVSNQFRAQILEINNRFANARMDIAGIAAPAQPADIQFPAGQLPAIQTHYRQAAVGNNIPIAPGLNANNIVANITVSLNALNVALGQFVIAGYTTGNMNIFSNAINPLFINVPNEYHILLDLIPEFRRAKSRRIDFNNAADIRSATV